MDDTQVKALEEKLKSQLSQLELEQAVFERMVYKNKNQHRRCSYFQYLLKVYLSTLFFWSIVKNRQLLSRTCIDWIQF